MILINIIKYLTERLMEKAVEIVLKVAKNFNLEPKSLQRTFWLLYLI